MRKLNGLQKDIINDKVYRFIDNFNDDELDYAIDSMQFWQRERKIQLKEQILKEMQEELDNKIGEIELDVIKKYEDKYNIAWCYDIRPKVEYVLFEEKEEAVTFEELI